MMGGGQLVGLSVHEWYPVDDAIAAFGNGVPPETFCDGQFIVLPTAVLGLIGLAETSDQSHLSSPAHVVWRPSRFDYAPAEETPWLPDKVGDVWDRSQREVKRLREHHMFLRLPIDEQFLYAGTAHLGSYGSMATTSGSGVAAHFSLTEKLPRPMWLRFGGYPGWLVEVNHRRRRVGNTDRSVFKRLLGETKSQVFSHLSMTRYEGDSLTIHFNAHRAWLMYQRYPADWGVYTRDHHYAGDPNAEEIFLCDCGIDLEFPASKTVPRDVAIRAALEFFDQGQQPRSVEWMD